ncbi:MAG: hypothetical protein LBS52_08780 [Dysgonamonadaceae bacterium]|jgi:hypothetical protein|nr:hypothetical protein [Dysgonamonadaceae bacterium]
MKTNIKTRNWGFILSFFLIAIYSCTDESNPIALQPLEETPLEMFEVKAVLPDPSGTRLTYGDDTGAAGGYTKVYWSDDTSDKIAYWSPGSYPNFLEAPKSSSTVNATNASFTFTNYSGYWDTSSDRYCVFPYVRAKDRVYDTPNSWYNYNSSSPSGRIWVDFKEQSGTKNACSNNYDIMVAKAEGIGSYSAMQAATLKFQHKVAILKLTVKHDDFKTISINKLTLKSDGLSSIGWYKFAEDAWEADTNQGTNIISVTNSESINTSTGEVTYYMAVIPGQFDNNKIEVISEYDTYAGTLSNKELKAGSIYRATINVTKQIDGHVSQRVAAHSLGAGTPINIVFMGDGFTETDITDGTYMDAMDRAINAFFSKEPYITYKKWFNAWVVDVVSEGNGVAMSASIGTDGYCIPSTTTRLKTRWRPDPSRSITGDHDIVKQYAYRVPAVNGTFDDLMVIVIMKCNVWKGTCWMWRMSYPTSDYGNGQSISYFANVGPPSYTEDHFRQMVLHEAGGHGFSKLADEYNTDGTPYPSAADIATYNAGVTTQGWSKNIDITGSLTDVKWNHFIDDSPTAPYYHENIQTFEGASYHDHDMWRPTQTSIMRSSSILDFNAPSRESIYYRIHKLVFGASWVYDFDTFKAWDAPNNIPTPHTRAPESMDTLPPLGPPQIVVVTE